MLVLLPIVVALALVPALASAALFSLVSGSNAHAFSVPYFTVTSNTTQAAAHPDVMVSLGRTGNQDEDLKDLIVDLPPGLIGNPDSVPSKCSHTYFSLDWCSNNQQVGTISTDITAMGILPLSNVDGAVYVLQPNSYAAATLGYVLRPIGSQLGVINKAYIKNDITVRSDGDYGLKNTHLNIPRQTAAVLIVPVPITMEHQELLLQGKAGKYKDGKPFMINSSSCAAGTAKLTATSYSYRYKSGWFSWKTAPSQTVTRTTPYTSTGCENVSADASFSQSVTNNTANGFTGGPIVVAQDQSPMTIQRSTIKDVEVTFPQGTSLNFDLLGSFTGCTASQYQADTCPAGSRIGSAQATVPYLPPDFNGDVYALDPIGSTLHFGVVLRGPRGIKARFTGVASVVGVGTDQRVVATVSDAPQFPLSSFSLNFSQPILRNPENCGPQTVTAKITGHSGASVTRSSSYTTINCPPDTTIDSTPGSPTNDATPTVSFSASLAGSSFTCAVDSGSFSPCTSPYTVSPAIVGDGTHRVRVAGCLPGNPSICDASPAEYEFTLDTAAPSLAISSPSEGATIGTSSVSVSYAAEVGATLSCKIDTSAGPGSYVSCQSTSSHSFAGVDNGPATISVRAVDGAGNETVDTRNITVNASSCPGCADTAITDGPRNGLQITKRNPTYEFESTPTGAPGFECAVDGGTWAACSSPYAIPPVASLDPFNPVSTSHDVCVRAIGDLGDPGNTTDLTPACATFELVDFDPQIDVNFLDNTNNAIEDTTAGAHPDVEIDVAVGGGQPDELYFELPNGFWGSLAAADRCSQTDVAAGACGASSKIGDVSLTLRTYDNTPHTFTSDLHLADGTSGNIANLAVDMPISIGGNDYGALRDQAQFGLSARYVLSDPTEVTNVENPRGMNTTAFALPSSSTGLDGTVEFNVSDLDVHIDGDIGLSDGTPLLTAPSNCAPLTTSGYVLDKEFPLIADPDEIELHYTLIDIPYQATDCASLPFDPDLSIQVAPSTRAPSGDLNLSATATLSLPPGHSTIKRADITVPYSVQPQYDGLIDDCLPANTRLVPPACNEATTRVGTATVSTPLLEAPITGKVYLEDSGAALPNLYVYLPEPTLGLDVRLRLSTRTTSPTIPPGSQIQFLLNAQANGNVVDVPDIPISALAMTLVGSATNGPIAKLSTDCYVTDNSATGTITAWSGDTEAYSDPQTFTTGDGFDACPNTTTP
jgi:hypothetical protein